MIKYYKDLKHIMDYLPSSVTSGSSSSFTPGTCKPTSVKAAVDRIFCDDNGTITHITFPLFS